MCGIIGYVGKREALAILLQGLKRLEYRGYDSAGIALLVDNKIEIQKSEGRLENLEFLFNENPKVFHTSVCGIGHTRWATHGKPTTQNAHPHKTGHVVIVHNGIIENYLDIKRRVLELGFHPLSETDSELFGFLVLAEMNQGKCLVDAVRLSFSHLVGQCSVVVMSEQEPGVVVGVRNGSPLVIASDPLGGVFFASDPQPLIQFSQDVIFLEHGDLAVGTQDGIHIYELETGDSIQRLPTHLEWTLDQLDKGGYPHFMLKEIYEQPTALVDTFNGLLDRGSAESFTLVNQPGVKLLESAEELVFVACGSSLHAALLAKYWIESWAKVPVSVELASEFRYREPILRPGALVIGISQSGETADTLAALREVRKRKFPTLGISNVRNTSISREADAVLYMSAGPEIGVASTKTFTSQILTMLLIAGYLSRIKKSRSDSELLSLFNDLVKLPHILALTLDQNSKMNTQIRNAIDSIRQVNGFFFIGRGYSFPIALEGALKLKEIAYDHAEGYAAGELKHGPIAMIDKEMVVIVLAPRDSWRDKTVSNLEEVKARGAKIIGIGDSNDTDLCSVCDFWIPIPTEMRSIHVDLLPFVLSVVVQLLSYYRAVLKGTDVDKPRNLAKSVTVE